MEIMGIGRENPMGIHINQGAPNLPLLTADWDPHGIRGFSSPDTAAWLNRSVHVACLTSAWPKFGQEA